MEAEIRFPTLPEQVPGPSAYTSPGRNTAKACVSVCMRQRNLATTFWFLIVFYLTTALPKVKVQAALENRKKTQTPGYRANALCGCQDLRLAKSLFWSSLCCPCSGSLVARSLEQCWACHWIYIYLVRSFGFRCFSKRPRGGHSLMERRDMTRLELLIAKAL